jgi:hypothetical protein
MSEYIKISPEIRALGREAEREIRPYFERLEEICDRNTEKVLAAFAKNRVSDNLFAGTTGYGYDDYGRDTLDKIYADIFGTEAALVRIGFVNGTHALSCAMFSAVKTGDTVLSVTGPAYDTLQNTITGDYCGSMKSYGIGYKQVDLKNGEPDLPAIKAAAADENIKLVFIQRIVIIALFQVCICLLICFLIFSTTAGQEQCSKTGCQQTYDFFVSHPSTINPSDSILFMYEGSIPSVLNHLTNSLVLILSFVGS